MPDRAFTQAAFQAYLAEHKLMGSKCSSCGAVHLPPRPLCPDCYGSDMEWVEVGGEGEVAAFTAVSIAPIAMIEAGYGRDNPYCSAVVRLKDGPAISGQLIGVDALHPETIQVGLPVKVSFIDRDGSTFLAFEPE